MVRYLDNNNSGFAAWNANRNATGKKQGGGFLRWFLIFIAVWWAIGIIFGKNTNVIMPEDNTVVEIDVSKVPVEKIDAQKITADVQGLRISNIDLLDFRANANTDDTVKLLSGGDSYAEIGVVGVGTTAPAPNTIWKKNGDVYTWRNADGVEFNRIIVVNDYVITVNDEIKNNTKKDFSFAPYAKIIRSNDKTSSAGVYTGLVVYANNDIEHDDWRKVARKPQAYTTTNGFAGFVDQYWETVADIESPDQTIRGQKYGDLYQSDINARAVNVAANSNTNVVTYLYAGPRDSNTLKVAAQKIHGIDKTVDYGWFWFLAMPMLWLINTINAIVMNYGVAIIIMTILLRLLMWPLTRKSFTSMATMQKMQPEMQRIQKLYANDKQRMQIEMMKLYQTHKTSPMSGCLPMLIQIPIFFALYKALVISVQMRNAEFLWISDLAVMDPYFILPILMGVSMWLQQRLQSGATKSADKNDITAQTQRAMRWMPIIFTVMFAWMPAGLVLYWTVSNLFGILQMYIIKRNMDK
ncbi:MAG: membrane protein insertase YidC [Alphaproteobacteria bacterium]|nr:membrane protein insertase YidC [Alphaproteobacteria bacterium]